MQCSQCGSANADDSRFCTTCGAALGAPDPAAVPSAPAPVPPAQPVYAPPPAAAPGYAPPPGYAAPAYAPPPQAPAPKKKRTGCIVAIVIVGILLFCCLGSAAAIYFGVASLGKPRDLGVAYSQKDYDSATVKLGIDVSKAGPDSPTAKGEEAAPSGTETGSESSAGGGTEAAPPDTGASDGGAPSGGSGGGGTSGGSSGGGQTGAAGGVKSAAPVTSGPAAGTTVIYEGSVPVDIELTNEEFSALISLNHYSPNWLVKDMQVRFGDGNTVEMSGYVEYEGQRYPVFVAGTAQVTGPRTVGGTATAVNVAGYDVPAEYYPYAAEFLAGLMNDWLAQMDGLSLESVEISDGLVHIKGSVPASVIRVPASQ